ncbi:hypothetical protein [Vulcanisaeta distributa]|uniref:hypothetical protein n=1 Tax=Vulcanisaeta distributa TaxID=164451 RepID=UPI000A9EDDF6|nr:hypothetical protein [Vulcanisaeta distributa]
MVIAALSVVFSVLSFVRAQPSPVGSLRLPHGVISYYSSTSISVSPGLVVRVYAINGSRIYPVQAFVAVYGLTPRHIVPIAYGFSSMVSVPFNNTNWLFIANRWLSFNPSVNEYNTSLLVFITYIDFTRNESWIEAYSVPYNIGWVMGNPGRIKYIVLTAYINLSSKPFRVVPVKQLPQGQPVINSASKDPVYTEYNCVEQSPTAPKLTNGPYIYYPILNCYGFTGPIPLDWITWSQGITNEYKNYGLDFLIDVFYSGRFTWDAVGYYENGGFSTIGTSYQASVNWNPPIMDIGDSGYLTQPGSFYFAYDGSFALANYTEYYYNIHTGYVYVGNVVISEVISVSSTSWFVYGTDYGNGPISYIYKVLILLAEQGLGYPALNKSTIVTYASWVYGRQGPGCGVISSEPISSFYAWWLTLESLTTTYGVSPAQLGVTLGTIGVEPAEILLDLIGLTLPPNTSISLIHTEFEIEAPTNNLYHIAWYLSLINASDVFGISTFGFIVNATNYYQGAYNCNG